MVRQEQIKQGSLPLVIDNIARYKEREREREIEREREREILHVKIL